VANIVRIVRESDDEIRRAPALGKYTTCAELWEGSAMGSSAIEKCGNPLWAIDAEFHISE
jgi:hypothetical protein